MRHARSASTRSGIDPPAPAGADNSRYIEARDVRALLAISKPTLERWLAAGRLPPPIRLGNGRTRRWLLAEILLWLDLGAPPLAEFERLRRERRLEEGATCGS